MRAYTKRLSEVTAGFPGTVYDPRERLNESDDYEEITEEGVVPGAANYYTVELDHGIATPADLVVKIDGVDAIAIDWELPPGAGEVAVHYDGGWLRFDSTREADALEVTYFPLGSVSTAEFENRIQKELRATQLGQDGIVRNLAAALTGINGKVVANSPFAAATFPSLVSELWWQVTAATAITRGPELGLRTSVGVEIFPPTVAEFMTAVGKTYTFRAVGDGAFYVALGTVLQAQVATVATGTSLTLRAWVKGYQVDALA